MLNSQVVSPPFLLDPRQAWLYHERRVIFLRSVGLQTEDAATSGTKPESYPVGSMYLFTYI